MNEEKLIEIVRKYPLLYDVGHSKYADSVRKELTWRDIAEELKHPAVACKQKWQSLRDCFRRALNKRKTKTGLAAKKIKKWKYEEEMAFLIPFFTNRSILSSINNSSEESDTEILENVKNEEQPDDTDPTDVVANAVNTDSNNTGITDDDDFGNNTENRKRKMEEISYSDPPTASSVLTSFFLEEMKKSTPTAAQFELDAFFLSISATVKKFSPYCQAIVKNKIFSLVSQMELQQLSREVNLNEPMPSPSTSASSLQQYTQDIPTLIPKTSPEWGYEHM